MDNNIIKYPGSYNNINLTTAKKYSDFPRRILIHNPFNQRPITSYGVILYAVDTQRWLLVQRVHSPEYIELIRGSYIHSRIPILLSGLTKIEIEKLKELLEISDSRKKRTKFAIEYYSTVPSKKIDVAYYKFLDCHDYLKEELKLLDPIYDEPEWLWPKGRSSGSLETQLDTALREFREETGISTENMIQICTQPILESYTGKNDRIYQTKCWVFLIFNEIEPPNIKREQLSEDTDLMSIPDRELMTMLSPVEIKKQQWFSHQEAYTILRDSKRHALIRANELILSHLSRNKY